MEWPSPIVVGPVCHTVTSSLLAGAGDVDVTPPLSQASQCSLLRKAANDEARRAFFTPVTSPSLSSVGDDTRWKNASTRNSEQSMKVTQSQQFTAPYDHDRWQSTR